MRRNCSHVVLENFFEPCILYLLSGEPGYGYELNRKLKEYCLCPVNIGNLYRGLNRLVRNGYVVKKFSKSKLGPDRGVYAITPAGRRHLAAWIGGLEKQNAAITLLISNYKKKYAKP